MTTAPPPVQRSNAPFIVVVVIVLLALLAVSVRFDWEQKIMRYLQDHTLAPKAQLTVTVNHGQTKASLDGNEIGSTPLDLNNLAPGKSTLQLTRDPNPNNFYAALNIPVNLVARTQTVVVADLGPSYDTSSFWVTYVDDQFADNSVYVETIPSGAQVTVNNEFRGQSPLPLNDLTPGTYEIKLSAEGYQELTTSVQSVAHKTIFLNAKLYKNPLTGL